MVVSIPKFTGPQLGAALSVVGGTMALMWALTGEKRSMLRKERDGRSYVDSDSERAREQSRKDAMTVHPRPSVDANTKDARPSSSKFV